MTVAEGPSKGAEGTVHCVHRGTLFVRASRTAARQGFSCVPAASCEVRNPSVGLVAGATRGAMPGSATPAAGAVPAGLASVRAGMARGGGGMASPGRAMAAAAAAGQERGRGRGRDHISGKVVRSEGRRRGGAGVCEMSSWRSLGMAGGACCRGQLPDCMMLTPPPQSSTAPTCACKGASWMRTSTSSPFSSRLSRSEGAVREHAVQPVGERRDVRAKAAASPGWSQEGASAAGVGRRRVRAHGRRARGGGAVAAGGGGGSCASR